MHRVIWSLVVAVLWMTWVVGRDAIALQSRGRTELRHIICDGFILALAVYLAWRHGARIIRVVPYSKGGRKAEATYQIRYASDITVCLTPLTMNGRFAVRLRAHPQPDQCTFTASDGQPVPALGQLSDCDFCRETSGVETFTIEMRFSLSPARAASRALGGGPRTTRIRLEVSGQCEVLQIPNAPLTDEPVHGFPVLPIATVPPDGRSDRSERSDR